MNGIDQQRLQRIAAEVERIREIDRHRRREFARFAWRRGPLWFVALLVVAFGLWQLFWLAVGLLLSYWLPFGIG